MHENGRNRSFFVKFTVVNCKWKASAVWNIFGLHRLHCQYTTLGVSESAGLTFAFSIGRQIGTYLRCLLGFEYFNWRIKKLKLQNNFTLSFQNNQSTINFIKVIILMIESNIAAYG